MGWVAADIEGDLASGQLAKGEEGRAILSAGPPLLHLRPLRLQFS